MRSVEGLEPGTMPCKDVAFMLGSWSGININYVAAYQVFDVLLVCRFTCNGPTGTHK